MKFFTFTKMGFQKLGILFLLLSFQLHLLPVFPISLKNLLLTDFDQQQNVRNEGMQERSSIEVGVKHVVSINRRGGGGGGGHGGGGHGGGGGVGGHEGGGEGGHGNNGDKSPFTGGAVIPLYAAGAGGFHHRNDHQHHGANSATPLCSGLSYLVFIVFLSLVFYV